MCHGDVDDQKTVSQEVWKMHHPDAKDCPVKFHRHYRLVVKEVVLPMSEFKNAEELVFLVTTCIIGESSQPKLIVVGTDVVLAHGEAYKKGVMHRDISAGNVLILVRERVVRERVVDEKLVQERDGFLTDWELSKRVDAPEQPRQPDRTVRASHVHSTIKEYSL